MTANPIKIVAKVGAPSKLQANEWAAIAREKGLLAHARAWDARAEQLGEHRIPDGLTVRFNQDGMTYRVPIK